MYVYVCFFSFNVRSENKKCISHRFNFKQMSCRAAIARIATISIRLILFIFFLAHLKYNHRYWTHMCICEYMNYISRLVELSKTIVHHVNDEVIAYKRTHEYLKMLKSAPKKSESKNDIRTSNVLKRWTKKKKQIWNIPEMNNVVIRIEIGVRRQK